ncbi:MAG TPA: hypothetical protein ENI52_01230 [Thermoplasmata archaeon]|nr:hypothetical protein [Thermoplasmata archaeon]
MANVQKENGYVTIANALVDALCHYRIAGQEWQILWTIIRKTYGWNKKEDHITLSQFEKATGIKRPKCHYLLKSLYKKNMITIRVIQKGNTKRIYYGIQKDFDKWRVFPKKVTVPKKDNKPFPKKATKPFPKKANTKSNKPTPKDRFIKPTLKEIEKYCQERKNNIDPQQFRDFYEAKGWMIGKNKMKDWKAAVRLWERRHPAYRPKSVITFEKAKTMLRYNHTTDIMLQILEQIDEKDKKEFYRYIQQQDDYLRGLFQHAQKIFKERQRKEGI